MYDFVMVGWRVTLHRNKPGLLKNFEKVLRNRKEGRYLEINLLKSKSFYFEKVSQLGAQWFYMMVGGHVKLREGKQTTCRNALNRKPSLHLGMMCIIGVSPQMDRFKGQHIHQFFLVNDGPQPSNINRCNVFFLRIFAFWWKHPKRERLEARSKYSIEIYFNFHKAMSFNSSPPVASTWKSKLHQVA